MTLEKRTIGLIGVGNMGAAILEGVFAEKIAGPNQVWIFDTIKEKAKEFAAKWKTHLAASNEELVGHSRVIVLAVKPQDLAVTAEEIRAALTWEHLLISILAGTPLAKIKKILGREVPMVRAMPNLGAKVGQAVTALAGSSAEGLKAAEQIFSGCGKTLILEERHFDLVTAVSGSGPAYFFLLMEFLMKECLAAGLKEDEARLLAVQTALGAALLAQSAGESPEALRKKVTSKGGTTEAALSLLEKKNFSGVFHEALQAALQRGRELSGSQSG